MSMDTLEFLVDMRRELKDDNEKLEKKLDRTLETLGEHETRIVIIEKASATLRWLGRTAIIALAGGIADLLLNHVPHWFR